MLDCIAIIFNKDSKFLDSTLEAVKNCKVHIVDSTRSYKSNTYQVQQVDTTLIPPHIIFNQIINSSNAKYFCIIENNCLFYKDKIIDAIHIMDTSPEVGMVISDYIVLDQKNKSEQRVFEFPLDARLILNGILPNYQNVYRTDLFKKMGGFQISYQDTLIKLLQNNVFLSVPKVQYYLR